MISLIANIIYGSYNVNTLKYNSNILFLKIYNIIIKYITRTVYMKYIIQKFMKYLL
jgi:hypothetical protein